MNNIKDLKHEIIFPTISNQSKWNKKSLKVFEQLTGEEMIDLYERLEYVQLCIKGELKYRAGLDKHDSQWIDALESILVNKD